MKAVDEAFKRGVNFFDVAPFYASGDAERVHGMQRCWSFNSVSCVITMFVASVEQR